MTVPDPTISLRGLTKRYGDTTVVDGLTVELRAGEVFGLLGPNGAGKTTTILMLLGLTERTAGEVRVLGHDPARHPLQVKRWVGYMPDAVGFYETMTGRENLRYTARLNGLRDADGTIGRLLSTVGLEDVADRPVATYSRGMRQRLGVADALVKDPAVLVLDEPTTAIDPAGVGEMLDLIRRLADGGLTVLLSSHLLHQVQAICDRVAIFVAGRVVALGSPDELAETDGGPEVVEVVLGRGEPLPPSVRTAGFVRGAEAGRRAGSWTITVEHDTTPDLVSSLVAAGCAVTAVHPTGHDLDAVYRRSFEQEVTHG